LGRDHDGERSGWDRQPGSSASECGYLELWEIELVSGKMEPNGVKCGKHMQKKFFTGKLVCAILTSWREGG